MEIPSLVKLPLLPAPMPVDIFICRKGVPKIARRSYGNFHAPPPSDVWTPEVKNIWVSHS